MVFFAEQQAALAGLEKHLNIPTVPIDTDNVVFAQRYICANYGNPVLAVVPVANTDNFSIQSIFTIFVLSYLYVYRQEIPGTAAPFLAGGKIFLISINSPL